MPTTEAQVRAYLDPEEPNYQAAAAALGTDALPVLDSLIQGDDALLASKAAYLASLIPGDHAARVLEQAARSVHPTVRVAAAAGLQKRPDVSEDVVATLTRDPDAGVRQIAVKAVRGRAAPASRAPGGAREPGGPSTGGAGSPGLDDEHGGGGPSGADAEPSAGEGGGDLGDARSRAMPPPQGIEAESGGGGDLTGAAGAAAARSADAPDGGGTFGGGGSGDAAVSEHGGGRV